MKVVLRGKVGSFSSILVSGLLAACGGADSAEVAPMDAPCSTPASLDLAKEGGIQNEWLVTLKDDVADLDATADTLAARHGFAISARLGIVRSFVATMPNATLAKLRCDPSVTRIMQNRVQRALAG